MNKYKLRDLLTIHNGKDYRKLSAGNVPVYGTGGLMTRVNNALYSGDSILLPRKGTLDNIMYVTGEFWTVDTMYWTTINFEKAYPKYLYYYLSLLDLSSKNTGSALPSMTYNSYYDLDIELPDLSYQKKVAEYVSNIDQKIAINNKISKELESMAKTIYNYWFLQFEFPDKDGKPYKSNGGKMVWNDQLKQEIPEGWEVNKLKSILAENPKSHIKVNEASQIGEIPFFTSGENILFVNSPSVSGLNCYLNTGGNAGVKCFLGDASYSTDTWSVTSNSEMKYLLPFILKSLQPSMDRNFFQGTGLKHLQKNLLRDFLIIVPNTKVIDKFKVIINDSFKHESHIYIENKELNSIRDFLLPMLMNGQVTIET